MEKHGAFNLLVFEGCAQLSGGNMGATQLFAKTMGNLQFRSCHDYLPDILDQQNSYAGFLR